jgi:hypothetical protein
VCSLKYSVLRDHKTWYCDPLHIKQTHQANSGEPLEGKSTLSWLLCDWAGEDGGVRPFQTRHTNLQQTDAVGVTGQLSDIIVTPARELH